MSAEAFVIRLSIILSDYCVILLSNDVPRQVDGMGVETCRGVT